MSIIRNYFVITFSFILIGWGSADATYWESLESETPVDSLANIYNDIYAVVHTEEPQTVIDRMREHGDLWTYFDFSDPNLLTALQVMSDEDLELLILQRETPASLSGEASVTLSQFARQQLINSLRDLYLREKKLLRLENDVMRKGLFMSMFADNNMNNAPLDIYEALNEFDALWFGDEGVTNPDPPSFAVISGDSIDAGYSTDEQDWQGQLESPSSSSTSSANRTQGSSGNNQSIAANIDRMKNPFRTLEGGPLTTDCVPKLPFEVPLKSPPFNFSCGLGDFGDSEPGLPGDETESQDDLATTGAVFQSLLSRVNCIQYVGVNRRSDTNQNALQRFESCGIGRGDTLLSYVTTLGRELALESADVRLANQEKLLQGLILRMKDFLHQQEKINSDLQCISQLPHFP